MGRQGNNIYSYMPPVGSPLTHNPQLEDHWKHLNNPVNAVSLGFVATAILISMFLVTAIFERFLRPTIDQADHSHLQLHTKFPPSSPKIKMYTSGVSVLMPGDNVPTFIAYPAPIPCRQSLPIVYENETIISTYSIESS